jgi:hypothetical protein
MDELAQPDSATHWFQQALDLGPALDDDRQCLSRLRMARLAAATGRPVPTPPKQPVTPHSCGTSDSPLSTRATVLAESFAAAHPGEDGPARVRRIQQGLDSLGYAPHTKLRFFVRPLAAAARSLLDAGDYADAERYAGDLVALARLDSLTLTRSGRVGSGLLLQARAERGQGHDDRARALVLQAVAPLAFGLGPEHPLTRQARALADSLKVGRSVSR